MKRNGFSITEVVVAIGIMVIVLAVGVQLISTTSTAAARFHRRGVAIQELQNQLEHLEVLDWDKLNDDVSKTLELSDVAREQLDSAKLDVLVEHQAATEKLPEAKQLTVKLTWMDWEEQSKTIQISTWR
ncbi:MAG: type II secretion system protein, partial [Planctomycetia bacterium]